MRPRSYRRICAACCGCSKERLPVVAGQAVGRARDRCRSADDGRGVMGATGLRIFGMTLLRRACQMLIAAGLRSTLAPVALRAGSETWKAWIRSDRQDRSKKAFFGMSYGMDGWRCPDRQRIACRMASQLWKFSSRQGKPVDGFQVIYFGIRSLDSRG